METKVYKKLQINIIYLIYFNNKIIGVKYW